MLYFLLNLCILEAMNLFSGTLMLVLLLLTIINEVDLKLLTFASVVFASILVTAFVGTAIAFACFSCAAIVAKRREYLYLGGLLSSGLSILLWLQFAASIFGHSTGSFMFEVSETCTQACAVRANPSGRCFDGWKSIVINL